MHRTTITTAAVVVALATFAFATAAPAALQRPQDCTLTLDLVPDAAQSELATSAEPVIFVNTTESYPIRSFTLKAATKPHAPSVATVTADLALESTMATLLDRHVVIEKAQLACPTRNATFTNATIGYIGNLATSRDAGATLSFTMNFWSENLDR